MPTITEKLKTLTEENNVSVRYDVDLSRIFFDEWEYDLNANNALLKLGSGLNGVDYIVIGDLNGPYFSKPALVRMKKENLIGVAEEYGLTHIYDDWLKAEIIEEIHNVVTREFHYKNHYDETSWHDLDCDFTIKGYSQGDAIKVLILDDEWKWNTEEYLTNLFFDTPISGAITFKGEEYYVDEYLDNQYDFWNKKKFINNFISKYQGDVKVEFKVFLECLLPEELDYV